MKTAIINARIYDFCGYIEKGYVIFTDKITDVGSMDDFVDDGYEIVDAKGAFVLPGLVIAHTHIYSAFARGLSLPFDPENFQEILDQLWWKIDHEIDNRITYMSGIAYTYECLLNGVTTVIDHHASGREIIGSLEALKKAVSGVAGMRGIYCFESSDRFPIDDCIRENVTFHDREHSPVSAGLFGMHAQMSLSEESLDRIAKESDGIPIHCHVAESQMDEDDCLEKYHERIIDRLDRHGLIRPDSLLIHGVRLDPHELDIIKERGAYLVVNTTSNMNNAVGLPNIHRYLRKGIKVLVGNDGLSSGVANEYVNAFFSAHLRSKSPTAISLDDVRKMILNAYDYVSRILGIKLGRIEKGYEADLLIVPYKPFTPIDGNNAFGHVFYGLFNNFRPRDVFAGGRREVKDYKIVNLALRREQKKAVKAAVRLHARLRKGE